jgi:hypothetical protein
MSRFSRCKNGRRNYLAGSQLLNVKKTEREDLLKICSLRAENVPDGPLVQCGLLHPPAWGQDLPEKRSGNDSDPISETEPRQITETPRGCYKPPVFWQSCNDEIVGDNSSILSGRVFGLNGLPHFEWC